MNNQGWDTWEADKNELESPKSCFMAIHVKEITEDSEKEKGSKHMNIGESSDSEYSSFLQWKSSDDKEFQVDIILNSGFISNTTSEEKPQLKGL
ncbi:5503_t:CDS:2 [Dentiscutata erythropus]|uniref:5503_t:CDS:1 n=1 Tax=Dentiscutata erythropus TaxID=1348616 RepID=A0A9N9FS50_9GLOM|nr:5503_t:CDS:2 [Dentiscutata erythropus]